MKDSKKPTRSLWLFKEEPSNYSFSDLEHEGETEWSGVSNALALKHLRQCKAGDLAFYYHTGKEKAIVGVIRVVAPKMPQESTVKDVTVTVKPLAWLKHSISLAQVKLEKALASWELVRVSRLSVMPVTEAQWRKVMELSDKPT